LLFAFFFIYLLTSIISEYLKNYSLESCRFNLRKLILNRSQKDPVKTKAHQKEILNNFFAEAELFTPIFTLVPHRVFSAVISIALNFFFLSGLKSDNNNFTTYFILTLVPILIALTFFSYLIQSKVNQKENRFRRQENILFEEYLQKPQNPHHLEKIIDENFSRARHSF